MLCMPRSGSSCIAGVLHRLGVDMGEGHWRRRDRANLLGYYEDRRWQRLNGAVGGYGYTTQIIDKITEEQRREYQKLIALREQEPIWGVKHCRLCFVSQFIWPLLEDPRMVIVHRPFMDMAHSLVRYGEVAKDGAEPISLEDAMGALKRWEKALDRRVMEFPGKTHHVDYYAMLEDTEEEVLELEHFCYKDSDAPRPGKAQVEKAVASVHERLRHF